VSSVVCVVFRDVKPYAFDVAVPVRRIDVLRASRTPTGSDEPPYGRTDTKSQMVYYSMVHSLAASDVQGSRGRAQR
jgi:hypothetical protein